MAQFDFDVNRSQTVYLRNQIVETLGKKLRATIVPGAVAIYSRDANLETVIRSLQLILEELLLWEETHCMHIEEAKR